MKERLELACSTVQEGMELFDQVFRMDGWDLQILHKQEQGDTPVTIADREIERLIRLATGRFYWQDAFCGEETADIPGFSGYTWVVDPLDGTKNFVRGLRPSVIGIAIAYQGELIAAVVGNPFERTITFGEKGSGVFVRDLDNPGEPAKQVWVSKGKPIQDRIAVVGVVLSDRTRGPKLAFMQGLVDYSDIRSLGSTIWEGALVARGQVEAGLWDAASGFWDFAPTTFLVTEAGGQVSNLQGEIPKPGDQVILATNGENHDVLLEHMQRSYAGYSGPW